MIFHSIHHFFFWLRQLQIVYQHAQRKVTLLNQLFFKPSPHKTLRLAIPRGWGPAPSTLFALYGIKTKKKRNKGKKFQIRHYLKVVTKAKMLLFQPLILAAVSRIQKIFLLAQPNKVAVDQYFSVFLWPLHFKRKNAFSKIPRKMHFPAICRSKGQKFLLQKA